MPRGDGTGPMGTGPIGRGRGGCLGLGQGFGFGGRGFRGRSGYGFGVTNNNAIDPEILERQAARLEERAANLRNLAKQNRKPE